jgi:PKD repeat protein
MSGRAGAFWARRRRRRGQGGITLVEILVATGIASVMLAPIGAWLVLSLSTVGPTASRFSDASQARVLNTYLSRDVASAEIVLDAAYLAGSTTADCDGGQGGGSVVLQLLSFSSGTWQRVTYTEHLAGSTSSLWRRVCPNSGRALSEEVEILRGVTPSSASSTCTPTCDGADLTTRRQVRLSAEVGGETLAVSAAQRATVDPAVAVAAGGFVPSAVIRQVSSDLSPDGQAREMTVVLDSSESKDLLGSIVGRKWSVSGPAAVTVSDDEAQQVTMTFTYPGTYTVTLTVTDDSNQTAATSRTITVVNRSPVVELGVDRSEGGVGDEFAFTAVASDPDGDDPLTYAWDFGDGALPSFGTETSPTVSFTAAATLGPREVTVTVTDALGASAVGRAVVSILGGPAPSGITITPEPVLTAAGPRLGSVGGSAPPTLDATFAPGTSADVRWELVRPGGSVPLAASDSDSWARTFDPSLTGDFEVVMYDQATGTEQGRRAFRVNAAPVASFTGPPGGAYPLAAAFADTSTDDLGIDSWSWDFGFFGRPGWTSTAPSPSHTFTDPGTYQVVLTVTDRDGVSSVGAATVLVTGVPPQPPPPTWVGSAVTFNAVPGATAFRVATEHLDDDGCRNPGINATIDAVAQYDPSGPYSVSGGVNTCTGTNRRTVASVQVEAGSGNLSGPSVQAVRTL